MSKLSPHCLFHESVWPKTAISSGAALYRREKLLRTFAHHPALKPNAAEKLFTPFDKLSSAWQKVWSDRALLEKIHREAYKPDGFVFPAYFFVKEYLPRLERKKPNVWSSSAVVKAMDAQWRKIGSDGKENYFQMAKAYNVELKTAKT